MDSIEDVGLPWRRPTEEDWNEKKDLIVRMHEHHTLNEIRDRCRFIATKKMFLTRFRRWGLQDKNHKEPEIAALARKYHQRAAIGKPSTGKIRGRLVPIAEIERYARRKNLTVEDLVRRAGSRTPPVVDCRTPSPHPLDPPTSYMQAEQLFRLVRGYVEGSIEGGLWTDEKDENLSYDIYNCFVSANHDYKYGEYRKATRMANHAFHLLPTALKHEKPWLFPNLLGAVLRCEHQRLRKMAIELITQLAIVMNLPLRSFWERLEILDDNDFTHIAPQIYGVLTEAFEAHENYKDLGPFMKSDNVYVGLWTHEKANSYFKSQLEALETGRDKYGSRALIALERLTFHLYLSGQYQECDTTAASYIKMYEEGGTPMPWGWMNNLQFRQARSRMKLGDTDGAIRGYQQVICNYRTGLCALASLYDLLFLSDTLHTLKILLEDVGRGAEAQAMQIEIDEIEAWQERIHLEELL